MLKNESKEIPFWRSQKSKGRKKPIGKFGIDCGERGILDSRNKLNELTGKEWIYFLNSVWITAYPPIAKNNIAFDLRKIHPSPKPPALMRDIILFFTKRNQKILDPFAGVAGTLLGASMETPMRKAVGIELNNTYVKAYNKACKETKIKKQTMIHDDARNMLKHPEISKSKFDLILTDPPYWNLMNRKKNGQKKKLYGKNDSTPYSLSKKDVGNLEYKEYLSELGKILSLSASRLKDKKYMIVFCKDLQPTKDHPNLLHADLISEIQKIHGIRYKGMRIWHDQASDLYPFGYPYAFVMNIMHQYILIFRKEE
jgi:DNA modification methylase